MSALQALGGFAGDETPAQPAQQQAQAPSFQAQPATQAQPTAGQVDLSGRVGNWSATLPNGATIQLSLQADGSFTWVATSSGKSSSFAGTYSFEQNSLSLVRSTDSQKLAGAITSAANGFNFKLNGAKDAGLNFTRS